ncbi:MAG: bacterioferritin [Armatimonadota bacterium]
MASEKLLGLLNDAIARELQVSIQYMWQHVVTVGIHGEAVRDHIKEVAIEEMKHAEQIAERLDYLKGVPTTKPTPIVVGDSLKEMLELDVAAEEEAIEMYKEIIHVAKDEGDITTLYLFMEILAEEEEHHDFFTTALEDWHP